ncbi:MAG TPA: extracellular solute-binding protein [Candidatus Limiplasma sp.]|nr:extracellular solute-binding protein [Candidatus Limiplasma sp.]
MKKLLSFLLASIMVISCASALADADDFTYPMTTDQTISFYVGTGFVPDSSFASSDDSPFHVNLQKMTGITIDWSYPTAGTDVDQSFNQLMSSTELPDIIFYNMMSDAERYMEEGAIIDLTPYIQEYAPNYYAWLQSNPAYDKAMKTDSGKYYGFGFFREDGGWNDSYQGYVIRKDWLDECGLDVPETIDDWDTVLAVFMEKYGVAPFSANKARFSPVGLAGAFNAYGCFGASSDYSYYVDENNQIQYGPAQEEWLNQMLKLQEWWEKGYIDSDLFSNDDTTMRTKALNNQVGISFTSMGQMTNWMNDAATADNGAEWIAIPDPTAADGSITTSFGGPGIGTTVACISGDCDEDKIATALRLLDYAYTSEGNLFWNFGVQGESWEYDADGNIQFTSLVADDPDGINNAVAKYGGSIWAGCCIQLTRMLELKNSAASIEMNNVWYYQHDGETAGAGRMPVGITLTAEESDELVNYESAITTYVPEMAAKFITGEATAADWDEYLSQLESMGLSKALEIRQAAYDRYLAR